MYRMVRTVGALLVPFAMLATACGSSSRPGAATGGAAGAAGAAAGGSAGAAGAAAGGSAGAAGAAAGGSAGASGGGCSGAPNTPGGPDPWGGCWPGPNNTGVPAGTTLKRVPQDATSGTGWIWNAGSQGIYVTSCNVTLNALDVSGSLYIRQGNGTASASTPCVTLKNSRIRGYVDTDAECLVKRCGPLVMMDDEVDTSGFQVNRANVLYDNIYEWRVNNHGGNGPDHCDGNCEIHDSWEHGLVVQGAFHMNAIGSNGTGPGNRLTVIHCYMACGWDQAGILSNTTSGAGCTSDLAMLPDFNTVTLTAEHNYLAPSRMTGATAPYQPSYCLYPGQGSKKPYPTLNDYIANNVFARGPSGKCGQYGPVYGWGNSDVHTNGQDSGNVWGPGNMWDDGTPVSP